MENEDNKFLRVVMQLLVVAGIGAGAIWLSVFVAEKISPGHSTEVKEAVNEAVKEVVKEVIIKQPGCENSFDSFVELRNKGQEVQFLDKPLISYGNGEFEKQKVVLIKRSGVGSKVACGYLYAKMRNSTGPLHSYENLYLTPSQFGGHIHHDKSIVNKVVDKSTELLINLANIHYHINSDDRTPHEADWASLINVSDEISFTVALNTTDKGGTIESLAIVYRCWNPETGKETSDCRLEVKK